MQCWITCTLIFLPVISESSWIQTGNVVVHVRPAGLCVCLQSILCGFETHRLKTEKKNVFTDLAAL